jgi:transcriptional regulator with XRE-family HTH domain
MIKDNIRRIRKEKKISQAKLAEAVNLKQVTISYIESGRRKVKADEVKALAAALGVKVNALLNNDVSA